MQIELTQTEAEALLYKGLGVVSPGTANILEKIQNHDLALITAGAKLIHALEALEIEETESEK